MCHPKQMIVNPFLKRISLLEHIDRSLRLGLTVGVLGPKGVGKTSLVKCWLIERGLVPNRFRWIALSSMLSLSELLTGDDSVPLEKALDNFSQAWTQYEFIIWDDVHKLPLKQLNILLSFLKNSLFGPKHFVISDEDFQVHHSDIPVVYCNGFSDAEIESYFRDILKLPLNNQISIELIKKQTGGLPLLLNWGSTANVFGSENQKWNPKAGAPQAFWESLITETEMELLLLVSFLRQVPVSDIKELESLSRKFFLLKENNSYLLHSYMEDLVEANASEELKFRMGERALKHFETQGRTDFYIAWRIAIQIRNKSKSKQYASQFNIEKIDSVDKEEMRDFFNVLKSWMVDSNSIFDVADFRLARIFLHIGVLLGERKLALEVSTLHLEKWLETNNELSDEKSRYLYELLYWLHRIGDDLHAKKIFDFLQNRVKGVLKYLVQLELAFSLIAKEPSRALEVLLRIKDSIAKDNKLAELPTQEIQKLLAQLHFEMAKCKGLLQKRAEAIVDYERAEVIYGTLGFVSNQLLCKTNCIFELLNELEIEKAQRVCESIWPQLKKFDYQYLKCLNLLAQSVVAFESMRFEESIRILDQAQTFLPQGVSPKVLEDIAYRRVVALIGIGRYTDAQKYLSGLKENRNVGIWRRFLEDLFLDDLSLDVSDDELKLLALYGAGMPNDAEKRWSKTPLGTWILLEQSLGLARENKSDLGIANSLVGRMDQFLGSRPDATREKLVLALFKCQLAKLDGRDFNNSFEQVKKELNRLELQDCDSLIKAPLFALAKSILEAIDLENIDGWLKARQLDRWRWQHWLWPIRSKSSSDQFTLKTIKGETFLSEKGQIDYSQFDLVLDDQMGQVYFRSKEISEFHRKSILRQILRSLIESHPSGLSKSQLASLIWGERYSSAQHDPRIYTSIQRLRQLLVIDCIESWESGYRWSSRYTFALYKDQQILEVAGSKLQNLILQTLQNFRKSGIVWASRADLVQATQSSDSSVKRELNKLLLEQKINKKGSGPKVVYSMK